jgi:hypothetical protein
VVDNFVPIVYGQWEKKGQWIIMITMMIVQVVIATLPRGVRLGMMMIWKWYPFVQEMIKKGRGLHD